MELDKDFYVTTIRYTATRWLYEQIQNVFDLTEDEVGGPRHFGQTNIITEPKPLLAGKKCVATDYPPVLHAIGSLNRDQNHSLQAFHLLKDWEQAYENLHLFEVYAEDQDAEWDKLAEFLGLERINPPDPTPVGTFEDKSGAKAEYQSTGVVPRAIQRELEKVPRVFYTEHGEDPPDRGVFKISLLTIPHSGTQFLRHVLEHSFGIHVNGRHFTPDDEDPDKKIQAHTWKTIITLYDPILSICSRMNRAAIFDPSELDAIPWTVEQIRSLPDRLGFAPNTFLFNMHAVDIYEEVVRLAEFMGRPMPKMVDLTPQNTVVDWTGVKERYLMGKPDKELLPYIEELAGDKDLVRFYQSQGIHFPWMKEAA